MRRRAVVRALAALPFALAGCAGDLPGATGPRRPPESPTPPPGGRSDVRVVGIDVAEAPDGGLRVLATVRNDSQRDVTREVVATATLDGEEYVASTEVRVPAGGDVEATIDFDLRYDEYVGQGSVSVDLN